MSMAAFAAAPVEAIAAPAQSSAFQNALNSAGAAIYANPDAMGAAMMDKLEGFQSHETQFTNAITQAVSGDSSATGDATSSLASASPAGSSDSLPVDASPSSSGAQGLTTAQLIEKSHSMESHSLGMMMQTYSFSLEATLVTNAATTFTSSINTLVKTQ
jgi:hypothetical protein